MATTQENMRLYETGKIPKGTFQSEFIAWMEHFAEQKYGGRYRLFWTESDIARDLATSRMNVARWVNGDVPDATFCRRIARVFGLNEDMVLYTAGHMTFANLLSEIERLRFDWRDGAYIYSALKVTQNRLWRFSTSPWKERAELELDRGWKHGLKEKQIHDLALTVAILIERWATDPQREVPLYQRQVALSA
jgi:transcriptional regulator with XRE-family HTH domain